MHLREEEDAIYDFVEQRVAKSLGFDEIVWIQKHSFGLSFRIIDYADSDFLIFPQHICLQDISASGTLTLVASRNIHEYPTIRKLLQFFATLQPQAVVGRHLNRNTPHRSAELWAIF